MVDIPSGLAARHLAATPCSSASGIVRNADAPDSPRTGRAAMRAGAVSPDRS